MQTFGDHKLVGFGIMKALIFGRPFIKQFALSYRTVVLSVLSVTLVYCGQTAGWIKMPCAMEVLLSPGHIVLDGDRASSPPPKKKVGHSSPQFLVHVCCGQTAGWIKMKLGMEVGLGPGHFVLDVTQLPSPKGHSPQFSAHVSCGQMAGWIKMPLGREVGLGPGHIVINGDPAPPPLQGHSPQIFGQMVAHLSYC